jgi:formylglycine-generating enzyme required for sulfatase activity/dienelactone hydrolase
MDMIGKRLGHYSVESRLGEGGMGEVYRARDTRLDRSVAIKVLPEGAAQDADNLRRFIQEAKAASSLNHPNIVTIHEIGDGAVPFIVMEHIDGVPLGQTMSAPMSLDRFFDCALQITSALGAAHEAGVVHRDIKPGNIMVTSSGLIKVVDFGLARLASIVTPDHDAPTARVTSSPITAPGSIVGTVGYMSPEQIEGLPVNARSDVFSMGIVLYEMLTGQPAFRASSVIATLSAILRDEPTPLPSLRRDIPPALTRLVARCMAKDPASRYSDAGEVHRELLEIRQSLAAAESRHWLRKPAGLAVLATGFAVVLALAIFWWRRDAEQRWVRNEALPQIERLAAAQDLDGAYRLARRAMEVAPEDPQLKQTWANVTAPFKVKVESDPPGATVDFKTYAVPDSPWTPLGTTPTAPTSIPLAQVRFRLTKDGYTPIDVSPQVVATMRFKLHRLGEIAARMVAVTGGTTRFEGQTVDVPDFQIDQFEVTNREFKRFVDANGYGRPEFWKHSVLAEGKPVAWADAMAMMVDSTGRPGPATWELGSYAEGQDELPVEGVSWYEAAAYAAFVGKQLPTVYHWRRAATDFGIFSDVITSSNFKGKGAVAVGTMHGLGPYGTYDMAGNVKEWCSNAIGDRRFALGGAWFEESYQYLSSDAQLPLERRRGFGFRLMKAVAAVPATLTGEIVRESFVVPPPVDDATFALYARLFDYDPLPLDAKVEERSDAHASWRMEKVSFTAAYGNERIPAYLYLPKNSRPPFQVVVFFPGSNAATIKSSRNLWLRLLDFHVKSGRALIYPVYKGTYERGVPYPTGPNAKRELHIERVKDVRRVVDYIASRPDLDSSRLMYYGLSMGLSAAPCVLAVEPRFKAATLLAGGLSSVSTPETAPQNYLPRVKVPVLLITGRYDFGSPYETSQKPFFELLGTPAKDKRHVVLDGGHLPPQYNEIVKEMLAWADSRLGAVTK